MNQNNHYLNKVRVSLLMLLISGCTFAADSRPEVEVTIRSGSQYPICQDYAQILQEHSATTNNYCGVAISLENSDYGLPEWRYLNPEENMDIVRDLFFWHNFRRGVGSELYERQSLDKSQMLPELIDMLWTPYLPRIRKLINDGGLELQESKFDIDFDTKVESVYRMTRVTRFGIDEVSGVEQITTLDSSCDDFGLPGGKQDYIYFVSPDELPEQDYGQLLGALRLRMGGFFYWENRIYWAQFGAIMEPHTLDYIGLRQVCTIQSTPVLQKGDE